ncbi:4Fe-4S binding protein [Geopsychrobacter electrodiphilus]|uniref:4Fe-4S binding protein n=1 Tax=Geopsychrobacter electrodiphilus TaxID=225196 RepID=UPI000381A583|nr:4Fe-4S binding protein [Geopsychrobacter electrodiphilus]
MKDLLHLPLLGTLLKNRWFWRLSRLSLLAITLLVIASGWHHHLIPGIAANDPLMYTNFATFGLWVLWLMGLVLLALVAGRFWCAVCPFGWLNGLFSRYGFKRSLPNWLGGMLPVTLLLVGLQISVYLLAIHRYPDYTARLLALLIIALIFSSVVFRKRAFCQLFCPAGAVLKCYARIAPFELRVRDTQVCADCSSVQCVSEKSFWQRYTLGPAVLHLQRQRPGCPVDIHPRQINDNSDCTLCMNCVENCCNDNLRLGFRPWLAELGQAFVGRGEALLLLVLTGMVTANFSKVNIPLREWIFAAPKQTALLLGWQADGYFLLAALWITLLLPLLLVVPGLILYRLRFLQISIVDEARQPVQKVDKRSLFDGLSELLLPAIPLLLGAHLILAVVKLNAKLGYFNLVLSDWSGIKSYLAVNLMGTLPQPGVLISIDLLKWVVLLLLVVSYLLAIFAVKKVAATREGRTFYVWGALINISLLAGLYLHTVIRWLFLR